MRTQRSHITMTGREGMPGAERRVRVAGWGRRIAGLFMAAFGLLAALLPVQAALAAVPGESPSSSRLAGPDGQHAVIPAPQSPLAAPSGEAKGLVRVELKKTAPLSGTVRAGGAVSFEAALFAGEAPVPPDGYVFRWESDAGAKFLDPEGPAGNTVVFVRPGPQKVWVTVFSLVDGAPEPVAASEALEMDVAGPLFRLSVTPSSPRVGEEVRAVVKDFPVREDVDFRWAALPRNAALVNVGEKEISFYLRDDGPAEVAVSARMPLAGKDLGRASAVVTAKPYAVEVSNKGLVGPRPVVWKEGSGPEEVEAVPEGGAVLVRADVNPAPGNPPLTFAWSVPPGVRLEQGESGRQVKVAAEAVGSYKVAVEVRDSRELVVGRGEGTFAVTVSKADMNTARENAAKTARLTAEAVTLWNRGEVDRAVETAARAVETNPKSVDAAGEYRRIAADRDRVGDILHRAGEHLARDEFVQVAGLLDEAGRINGQYPAIAAMDKAMRARKDTLAKVDGLLASSGEAWASGDVEGALRAVRSALALDPGHEAARAARDRLAGGRDKIIAGLKEAATFLGKNQFESAAAAVAEVKGVNEKFGPLREMESAIAARREHAWKADQLLARARELWTAGDMDGALTTLSRILKSDPEHPGADAARRQTAQARELVLKNVDQAKTLLSQGKTDEALAALGRAKGVNAAYAPVRELESAVAERKNRAGRIRELRAAVQKDGGRGDLDAALAGVENILILDPADAWAKAERTRLVAEREELRAAMHRAEGLSASGRHDAALAALAQARVRSPGYPPLAALEGRIAEADRSFRARVSGALDEAGARLSRGDFSGTLSVLAGLGTDPGLSAKDERRAKELARAARAGQEKAKAVQAAQQSVSPGKQAATARNRAACDKVFARAEAKRAAGEHASAIRDYQEIVTGCPDYCTAYNNIGASLFTLGYARESLPWFEEARTCDPGEKLFADNAALTKRLAAQKTENRPDGRPDAQTDTKTDLSQCATAFEQAEKRRGQGDLAGAVRDYRRVVEQCPRYCAAYNNIGLALNKLGHVKESLPWFEEAYRCNPKEALFQDNIDIVTKSIGQASRDRPPGT
ncbi:tetratricopeptide repeat protein [Desulfolutivibrio sulfoxidireducens]|nr:tetratricopeptide repeat protein [Desulfolutivibrio sulfoxidireducens]